MACLRLRVGKFRRQDMVRSNMRAHCRTSRLMAPCVMGVSRLVLEKASRVCSEHACHSSRADLRCLSSRREAFDSCTNGQRIELRTCLKS